MWAVRVAPVQDSKNGEVFLGDGIHLGPVKNSLAVLAVGHLFPGEGRAEDILSQRLPSPPILTSDLAQSKTLQSLSLLQDAHLCTCESHWCMDRHAPFRLELL